MLILPRLCNGQPKTLATFYEASHSKFTFYHSLPGLSTPLAVIRG